MTVLVFEDSQVFEKHHKIPDLSSFLESCSKKDAISLILKTHDVSYHLCPIRKAVPHLKSAEFSAEWWIGEKIFPKGQTLVGGILPTSFMRQMVGVIAKHSLPLKGVFLWTDLIAHAFAPLPKGWSIIFHDNHLIVCQDGIMRVSRSCFLPLPQELPALLRYLKRFGFQDDSIMTVLSSSALSEPLPEFIHFEARTPAGLVLQGFKVQIPELTQIQRLAIWPQKIRKIAYGVAFLNIGISVYLGWQAKSLSETEISLSQQLKHLSAQDPVDESKMEAFAAYREFAEKHPNLLPHARMLASLMQGEAVATHLHWIAEPFHLSLHLDLNATTSADQLLGTFQSQFPNFKLTWQEEAEDPLKGVMIFD